KKGTGELPGVVFEEITYEGYGPGGVAFIVKVTTDNKVRAAQDVRSAFARHGGNLASTGAVSFQFVHAGQFLIAKEKTNEDALMEMALESGADDVIASDQGFEVRCSVQAFDRLSHALEQKGIKPDSAEIAHIPVTTV
ncbi:MAG: YebC/PmpR family DNA-binding transcriptional regulator, partial [Opitutus sp.]